jgi:hypothetical protein
MTSPLQTTMFNGVSEFYNSAATTSFRNDPGVVLTDECDAPTSAKIMSFGGWVKRNKVGFYSNLFSGSLGGSGVPQSSLYFDTDNALKSISYTGSAYVYDYRTAALFRDTTSWYHIWVQIDTTDGTQADRFKLYVNGVRITVFSNAGLIADGSPDIRGFNEDGIIAYFGHTNTSYGGNVYYSDWYFIDGSAVSPVDTVGEFKGGVFIPKSYSPTFGNNGFNLKFDQVGVGSPSSSTIGADSSGSSRHFISTAGTDAVASDCALPDSPENNFCNMNPLSKQTYIFDEGNLKLSRASGTAQSAAVGTFSVKSGKWYWEVRLVSGQSNYPRIGIFNTELGNNHIETAYPAYDNAVGARVWGSGANGGTNKLFGDSNAEAAFGSYDDGDVVQFALDMDNLKMYLGKGDTWYTNSSTTTDKANISDSSANAAFDAATNLDIVAGNSFTPLIFGNANADVWIANFGQDSTFAGGIDAGSGSDANGIGDFKYAPPTGFLALCSANLEDSTIGPNSTTQSDDYFNIILYDGDGATTQDITGVGFQPDWTWIKEVSSTSGHVLADSNRGYDKYLTSNENVDESNGVLNSVLSNGFRTTNSGATNEDGESYVAWNWLANGGTATATISESGNNPAAVVQANPTAGFSIVTYTGTGGTGTIAHGLGALPNMIIIKNRDRDINWLVYHRNLSATNAYLHLENTDVEATNNAFFSNSGHSTTTFSIGNSNHTNADGEALVAYCFADIEGYSKFGTYTANGVDDGSFVHLGFRPSFVMLKNTSNNTNGGNWVMMDDTRLGDDVGAINPILSHITANTNAAEFDSASYPQADFLSNGFKLRLGGTGSGVARNVNNAAGNIYIYMAFASSPFKYANAF